MIIMFQFPGNSGFLQIISKKKIQYKLQNIIRIQISLVRYKKRVMKKEFGDLKGFWERQSSIPNQSKLIQPKRQLTENTNARKNSIDIKNVIDQKKQEPNEQTNLQAEIKVQESRKTVAEMRRQLEGKIKLDTPQNSGNCPPPLPKPKPIIQKQTKTEPKKLEQKQIEREPIVKPSQIPAFKQSVSNLQNIFNKKQQVPVQTAHNDFKSKQQDLDMMKEVKQIQTPKKEDFAEKIENKPKYISVGKHRLMSSAMRNSSLTVEERADLIIRKIFGSSMTTVENNHQSEPMLLVRNQKKGKNNLGDFDEA